MRRLAMIAVSAAAAVLVWIGLSAQQQEMLPRPGPGSGIIEVKGTVSVANVPSVSLANVPSVMVTGPNFLQKGRSYTITWPSGDPEIITVVETGQGGGWVRVGPTRGSRWINLDAALAVEAR